MSGYVWDKNKKTEPNVQYSSPVQNVHTVVVQAAMVLTLAERLASPWHQAPPSTNGSIPLRTLHNNMASRGCSHSLVGKVRSIIIIDESERFMGLSVQLGTQSVLCLIAASCCHSLRPHISTGLSLISHILNISELLNNTNDKSTHGLRFLWVNPLYFPASEKVDT